MFFAVTYQIQTFLAQFVVGLSNNENLFSNFFTTLQIVCSIDRLDHKVGVIRAKMPLWNFGFDNTF